MGKSKAPWMDTLAQFLHPVSIEEFFSQYWEKKPLHLRAGQRSFKTDGMYSIKALEEAICAHIRDDEENEPLRFGFNLNACVCIDGEKVDLNPGHGDEVNLKEVSTLFQHKAATLQVLQPQQHTPALAELQADLEEAFGCLVGCNSYITPASSKGLAPHCDDVEVFVMQVEGKKHWKLHEPLLSLAWECSGDLSAAEIDVPVMELDLEPGDLLYFPRGWVHHAITPADGPSVHLTISTYQRNTWTDVLQHCSSRALRQLQIENTSFRKGLPVGTCRLPHASTSANQEGLRRIEELYHFMKESLQTSLVHHSIDFFLSRLPPSKETLRHFLEGVEIDAETSCFGEMPVSGEQRVRLLAPSFVLAVEDDGTVVLPTDGQSGEDSEEECSDSEDSEEWGSDDDESEAPLLVKGEGAAEGSEESSMDDSDDDSGDHEPDDVHVLLFHPLNNAPESHMAPLSPEALSRAMVSLPPGSLPAIRMLQEAGSEAIAISDLPVAHPSIALMVCVALWAARLLVVEAVQKDEQKKAKAVKKRKKSSNKPGQAKRPRK